MNLLDRTFTEKAWYWVLTSNNADGTKTYSVPTPVLGRWNDSPFVAVKPDGESIQLNARFATRVPLQAGGWLLLFKYAPAGVDTNLPDPHTLPMAREIDSITSSYSYDRKDEYVTGNLK